MRFMSAIQDLTSDELTQRLAYAGLVLVAYELVKGMIVGPIKSFYANTTFHGGPFKSYEHDVRSRDANEFEACLLYLRDFMEAIDASDVITIQELRMLRNDLAHDLTSRLPGLLINLALWERVDSSLFRLSNYRTRMDIGGDPAFARVEWQPAKGHEYLLFEHVVRQVSLLPRLVQRGA